MGAEKVQTIQRSLRCFFCGIIGILPGVGIPFAVVALGNWLFLLRRSKDNWNPAARYLHYGALAATLGILLTFLLAAVIVIEAGKEFPF